MPEALEKFGKQLLKANLALEKGLVRLDSLNVTPGRQRDLRKNSVKKVQVTETGQVTHPPPLRLSYPPPLFLQVPAIQVSFPAIQVSFPRGTV